MLELLFVTPPNFFLGRQNMGGGGRLANQGHRRAET